MGSGRDSWRQPGGQRRAAQLRLQPKALVRRQQARAEEGHVAQARPKGAAGALVERVGLKPVKGRGQGRRQGRWAAGDVAQAAGKMP